MKQTLSRKLLGYSSLLVMAAIVAVSVLIVWMGRRPPARTQNKTRVTLWVGWAGEELDKLNGFVKEFNAQHPEIDVQTTSIADSYQKMKIAFAGDDTPDLCATVWTHELADYALRGALEPLDPYLAQSERKPQDYYKSVWDTYQYQGKTYALSQSMITFFIGYNKKLFRQAGLDPEYKPKTVEEFDELARRLTTYQNNDQSQPMTCLGYPYGDPYGDFISWCVAFGVNFWDEKNQRVSVNTPQMIACLKWIKKNADHYGLGRLRAYQSAFGNVASPNNPFISGRVAMIMMGDWYRSIIAEYAPKDFEWGWFPVPAPAGGRPDSTYLTSSMFVIPRASQHKREAWLLLEWLTSAYVSENMHVGDEPSGRPALRQAGVGPDYQAPYWQFVGTLLDSPNAVAPPKFPLFDRFSSELTRMLDYVLNGAKTPEQAAREMQDSFQGEVAAVFRAAARESN